MLRKLIIPSPFLLFAIGFFIYAIYVAIRYSDNSDGWWIVVFFIVCGIALIALIVDIMMKLFLPSVKVIVIIQLLVLLAYGVFKMMSHTQYTVNLPSSYSHQSADNSYVTIIFNVDGQKKLPVIYNPFKPAIEVADNGFLLTSSQAYKGWSDTSRFELNLADGRKVGSQGTDLDYAALPVLVAEYRGKSYGFLTFILQPKEHCCGWSGKDEQMAHDKVVNQLKNLDNIK